MEIPFLKIGKRGQEATSSDLDQRMKEMVAAHEDEQKEVAAITAALPIMMANGDEEVPKHLARKSYLLGSIESFPAALAIVEASRASRLQSEVKDALSAERAVLAKDSNRLGKTFPGWYSRWLDEGIAKFRELNEDKEAHKAFNQKALPLGIEHLVDAETRLRGTSPHTEPARFEEREVWQNASGQSPGEWRQNPKDPFGPVIPYPFAEQWTKRRVRVQVQAEQFVPAHMPERLADAIRLVDMAGNQVWPPR